MGVRRVLSGLAVEAREEPGGRGAADSTFAGSPWGRSEGTTEGNWKFTPSPRTLAC